MPDLPSRQLQLYDAATHWTAEPLWPGPEEVIDAAVNCLVDGIDTPSLRVLAGASVSPKDSADEIKELVEETLRELELPAPGTLPRTKTIGVNGAVVTRTPRDSVRFEVRSTEPEIPGHEVLVYVNEVEMTSRWAGLGMRPFDLLVPENRLVATATPHQISIGWCPDNCCGSTVVVIVRDDNVVHWDWEFEAPIRGGASFKADEYDAEVARLGADRSWERPEDTTERLILAGVDRERLASMGLHLEWVAKDRADHDFIKLALYLGNSDWRSEEPGYQVFLRVPREGRTPQEVAAEALEVLADEPRNWSATWFATRRGTAVAPSLAGRKWKQENVGIAVLEPNQMD